MPTRRQLDLIKETCRTLRENQTPEEKRFWEAVRNRRYCGLRFVRQYPIIFQLNKKTCFFVADFCCPERKLVIELDGKIHECQKERDEKRDYIIHLLGYTVIRIDNDELGDIMVVLRKIAE